MLDAGGDGGQPERDGQEQRHRKEEAGLEEVMSVSASSSDAASSRLTAWTQSRGLRARRAALTYEIADESI